MESTIDEDDFDLEEISYEVLGISQKRWMSIVKSMIEKNLINGIIIKKGVCGSYYISIPDPKITLEGLEYLKENSDKKKMRNLIIKIFKLLKDILLLLKGIFFM